MPSDPVFDNVTRYIKHLPSSTDPTLVILKGHLLIEELVRQLIDKRLTKPAALADARLEFYQCVCLLEALFHGKAPTWLWTALKKLNSIRNKLAHNLEPAGIDDKISDFQTYVEKHRDKNLGLRSLMKDHPLKLALWDVHSEILVLLHPYVQDDA